MLKSDKKHSAVSSPGGLLKKSLRRMSRKLSPTSAGQQSSPGAIEKRGKVKSSKQPDVAAVTSEDPEKLKAHEHRVDIVDEKSNLLGYEIFSGKLVLDRKGKNTSTNQQTTSGTTYSDSLVARLTSKALIWGSNILHLEDVVSVTYNNGFRHFTVHAYPLNIKSWGLSCFTKPRRIQKDFRFLASSPQEATQWLHGFADQQCYVNCLPHPMASGKKQSSEDVIVEPLYDLPLSYIKCKSPPSIIVILNPRSGHGRSSKVFHEKVEPIFKLAGFNMKTYKTTHAGHAKSIAYSADFNSYPDGIVCVGGDGIVNEVLNGLLSRENQQEALSIPIGIIPAGSDNSLVWTVLGVRDPVSAALTIVKGGHTAADVLAVQWIQTGVIHYGTTVSYFGFLSDVLELSEKYQKRFGPLRYFVAGFLKFMCLPKYSFELEYLPMSKETGNSDKKLIEYSNKTDMLDLYNDIVRRSRREGLQRASSFSSIDSIMSPNRMSGGDGETTVSTIASSEPSEYVRGLDPKAKRLSLGRNNIVTEPDAVVHPPPQLSVRTRSKSRTDKAWAGLTVTTETRSSWAAMYDKEEISSTVSDPGPIWDTEPKWDRQPKWDLEPNWEAENPIQLPTPPEDIELGEKELVPNLDEKWVVKKGMFLGVLVCNHSCKTVQSLSSQVVAPKAVYDDNSLDLLLVHGSGRLRLLRFFICLQFGRHLSLPYVDYVKVKSVKLRPGTSTNNGCGIDGELLRVKGQVLCSLLPQQCRLIGCPAKHAV